MIPKDVRTGASIGALNTKISAFAKEMEPNCSLFDIISLDILTAADDLQGLFGKTDMICGELSRSEF